jgi:hypothetical protein
MVLGLDLPEIAVDFIASSMSAAPSGVPVKRHGVPVMALPRPS